MGILREGLKCFPGGIWSGSAAAGMAKPCEYCHLAAALVFCRTDNIFVCLSCDTSLHACHERVWMCEVCEQAAASVTCKADAAALCVTCDRDIHSANPLAERHERVPVVPFHDPIESVVKSTATTLLFSINGSNDINTSTTTTTTATTGIMVPTCIGHHEKDYNTDPWIPPNTITSKLPLNTEIKSMDFLFPESQSFLDFDYSASIDTQSQLQYNSANDSVVPVQTTINPIPFHHQENHFEIDFTQSHIKSYNTPSLSQSVSSSSLDVGIVPDGSSISEISHPFIKNVNNNLDLANSANQGEKLIGLDREARVLRYREKKKNRKFEKTIRYASRKAYAEKRPRIKGRFAKRMDSTCGVDSDIDKIFSGNDFNVVPDSRYGVVPSFLTHR